MKTEKLRPATAAKTSMIIFKENTKSQSQTISAYLIHTLLADPVIQLVGRNLDLRTLSLTWEWGKGLWDSG